MVRLFGREYDDERLAMSAVVVVRLYGTVDMTKKEALVELPLPSLLRPLLRIKIQSRLALDEIVHVSQVTSFRNMPTAFVFFLTNPHSHAVAISLKINLPCPTHHRSGEELIPCERSQRQRGPVSPNTFVRCLRNRFLLRRRRVTTRLDRNAEIVVEMCEHQAVTEPFDTKVVQLTIRKDTIADLKTAIDVTNLFVYGQRNFRRAILPSNPTSVDVRSAPLRIPV